MSEEEFPAVELGYELRFTKLALADLRCDGIAPGDLDAIEATTPWAAIVRDFRKQRGASPQSTGGSLSRMGRGDLFPLHGTAGGRAATWFDQDSEVCWFLAFTPEHDYRLLEQRAASGELLPSEDDETLLELEREELDFELRVGPGLTQLVAKALEQPRRPARGTVGKLMRLEVSAVVVDVEGTDMVDLTLVVHLPVIIAGAAPPPDWPGPSLLRRLAELATGLDSASLDTSYPFTVALGEGQRAIDPTVECAIAVLNWLP